MSGFLIAIVILKLTIMDIPAWYIHKDRWIWDHPQFQFVCYANRPFESLSITERLATI